MSRRALVTGAARGLAAGVAAALPLDGFDCVALTYRTTRPDETMAAVESAGARAVAVRVNFLDDDTVVNAALEGVVREAGPFDTLVHGVGPLVIKRFERLTGEDYRTAFDGNVRSGVAAARAVLPGMQALRFGRIVFFAMLGSGDTRPFRGFAFYQAAKSALVAFARCLALEQAPYGITVNVVAPGHVRDKSLSRAEALERSSPSPRGRPGTSEDVADAVRFLIARERDFITGAVLDVTGGLTQADERNEPVP